MIPSFNPSTLTRKFEILMIVLAPLTTFLIQLLPTMPTLMKTYVLTRLAS